MTAVQDCFDEKVRLPSPPAIALKILEAVRQEDNSFEDLARIIRSDPSLSVRILKIANSSLYGLTQPVDSLAQATGLIGTDALKNIALSFVIVQEFQNSSRRSFDLDYFWRRAITAAVAADVLGAAVGHRDQDLFVAGLLQDIGVLILLLSHSDRYRAILDEKRVSGKSLCVTEKEEFSCDHTEVGNYLLSSWNLPHSICQPIHFHHNAEGAPRQYRDSALLLSYADKISAMYHSVRSSSKSAEVHEGLAREWHVSEERASKLIDTVGERSREILDLFAMDPGDIKPFSQIIQEANEELSTLNFSYEQLVFELKQARQNAEQLARELQQANGALRELAYRDSLTGLYNYRYFQLSLESEWDRAIRYKHPLSLLMVDIDFFKKVNDTSGHVVGDEVLKVVSKVLAYLVRSCDIVVRYGGEEFVIILPETGSLGAKVLAQRLRRGVEQEITAYNGHSVSVTISVGIAATDLTETEITGVDLLECSDRALYRAKQNGRNRVEVGSFR